MAIGSSKAAAQRRWVKIIRPFIVAATLCVAVTSSQAPAQTPIPPTSSDYALSAAQSDQYEIVAAHDALAQSHDPRIQAFAQQMITDHRKTSEAVRRAASTSGLPSPPMALTGDAASMIAALQSLRGSDFDKAYIRQQILAHHQALAVQMSYAEAGRDPDLRAAAQQAVPLIQDHLQMAEQLSQAQEEP